MPLPSWNDIRRGPHWHCRHRRCVRVLYAAGYLHNTPACDDRNMWCMCRQRCYYALARDRLTAARCSMATFTWQYLNWQWVAGTFPANRICSMPTNVQQIRASPRRLESEGTVIDQSYRALDTLARTSACGCRTAGAVIPEEPEVFPPACLMGLVNPYASIQPWQAYLNWLQLLI
jgi:hypothetical protein